jgi:hypothetical protein
VTRRGSGFNEFKTTWSQLLKSWTKDLLLKIHAKREGNYLFERKRDITQFVQQQADGI